MAYTFLLDLLRQVTGILQPAHGGTGSTYGEERTVIPALNATEAVLPLYTLVQWKGVTAGRRIEAVSDLNSGKVLGVVVGYYSSGRLVEDDAPDGALTAVQTAGTAPVLIESTVSRGQYAHAADTDGAIYSTVAATSGAFGLVMENADTGEGHTTAQVSFPLLVGRGTGGGAGTGGGLEWTQWLDEDGTSLTNWDDISGTWTVDSSVIKQTDTADTPHRAAYVDVVPSGMLVIDAEIQVRSSTAGTYGGILCGFDGRADNDGGLIVRLNGNTDDVEIEKDSVSDNVSFPSGVTVANSWVSLRIVRVAQTATVYVGGLNVGSSHISPGSHFGVQHVGLFARKAEVWFRNVKSWYPDMSGLP